MLKNYAYIGKTKHRGAIMEEKINKEKLYLNPNLSLVSLAESMSFSEGYISQLINKNSRQLMQF